MGFYMLVQPEEDTRAEFVEHVQGHPALIISSGCAQITVQSPGRHDGPRLAIAFARQLGDAARLFADRLDGLTQVGPLSAAPPRTKWKGARRTATSCWTTSRGSAKAVPA